MTQPVSRSGAGSRDAPPVGAVENFALALRDPRTSPRYRGFPVAASETVAVRERDQVTKDDHCLRHPVGRVVRGRAARRRVMW